MQTTQETKKMPAKTRRRILLTVLAVLTAMGALTMFTLYQAIQAEAYSR